MLNNRDTLRCRTIALEAIRDYNIDNYMLGGRENWERLKYERVMWSYTHTWFALKKDAKAVIRPEYLEELEKCMFPAQLCRWSRSYHFITLQVY